MSNNLYYGEIAAKISAHLYQNPQHISQINDCIESFSESDTIWTLCADAARVFDTIEELSEERFVDWHEALEDYSAEILDFILDGQKPNLIDMVSLASQSIQNVRFHS